MNGPKVAPGPDAAAAFRTGVMAAAVLALAVLGALFWAGSINALETGFALLVVFPVYLVLAASALNVWLGSAPDETDLRPVYRKKGD
jgi:hypothetical protein